MKTITEYRDEACELLADRGRFPEQRGVGMLEFSLDHYADYLSGTKYTVPDDLEPLLDQRQLSDEEKFNVRKYIFAENILGSAPRIGEGFARLYPTHKYSPDYTLDGYMLNWPFDNNLDGEYADVLKNLIEMLEADDALKAYLSSTDGRIHGGDSITTLGIDAVMVGDSDTVADLFMTALPADLRKTVHDIVYDTTLARESAAAFLDAFPQMKDNTRFSLQNFLRHYNGRIKKSTAGIYNPMYRRFIRRGGTNWQDTYCGLLEEPVRSRTAVLDAELSRREGVMQEEEIRLLETLVDRGSLPYLLSMADEGSDAEDLFNALHLDTLTTAESRVLRGMLRKGGKKIREYLGVLRVSPADASMKYDWGDKIKDLAARVTPEDYARNEVLAAILYNRERQNWSGLFVEDSESALELMRDAIKSSVGNPVYASVMERVLAHFALRSQVDNVTGIVRKLRVKG